MLSAKMTIDFSELINELAINIDRGIEESELLESLTSEFRTELSNIVFYELNNKLGKFEVDLGGEIEND